MKPTRGVAILRSHRDGLAGSIREAAKRVVDAVRICQAHSGGQHISLCSRFEIIADAPKPRLLNIKFHVQIYEVRVPAVRTRLAMRRIIGAEYCLSSLKPI